MELATVSTISRDADCAAVTYEKPILSTLYVLTSVGNVSEKLEVSLKSCPQ